MRKFITAAGLGVLLAFMSPNMGMRSLVEGESPPKAARELYEKSFEGFDRLKHPYFEAPYLSKFNLSDNVSLRDGKTANIEVPPHSILNLNSGLVNYSPDSLVSVTYPFKSPTVFYKFAYLYNNSDSKSKASLSYDDSELIVRTDGVSEVRNGPFLVYSKDGKKLDVKSFYGTDDVVPMKVILEREGSPEDSLRFVDEWNYPPYFVLSRFSKKDSIDWKDAKEILGFYENLYGDYFKINYKALVCSDPVTLIMKTAGIDLEKELSQAHMGGNSYRQKSPAIIKNYIERIGLSKDIHLFEGGNLEKILNSDSYSDVNPENFGIKRFYPGQVLLFTRFYKNGPMKGKVQRGDVHMGIIYKTDGDMIKEASMVTSHMTEPPYNKDIMLTNVNFRKWYGYLRNYTGSDETPYTLTYRVYGIIDWLDVINHIKSRDKDNLPGEDFAKYETLKGKEVSYLSSQNYNSNKTLSRRGH
jgi:hypothetical protein